MRKDQKDYTANRIRRMATGKVAKTTKQKPSLKKHIYQAAIAGTLKAKRGVDIVAAFREDCIDAVGDRYDSPKLSPQDVFATPQSFKDESKAFEAEEKCVEKKNKDYLAAIESIIDRIYLGEFETGADAILEAKQLPEPK